MALGFYLETLVPRTAGYYSKNAPFAGKLE